MPLEHRTRQLLYWNCSRVILIHGGYPFFNLKYILCKRLLFNVVGFSLSTIPSTPGLLHKYAALGKANQGRNGSLPNYNCATKLTLTCILAYSGREGRPARG